MGKIRIPTKDLRFEQVALKDLREDYVYSLIQHDKMTEQQFARWLEIVRDEWYNHGRKSKE